MPHIGPTNVANRPGSLVFCHTDASTFQLVVDGDPCAKYRVALRPNIDPDEMVIDVNTKLTDVEHGKPDPFVSSCE
jgi:hypothetical protein